MELVDVTDSKSVGGDIVWVRVPPPAPKTGYPAWDALFFLSVGDVKKSPGSTPSRSEVCRSATARRAALGAEETAEAPPAADEAKLFRGRTPFCRCLASAKRNGPTVYYPTTGIFHCTIGRWSACTRAKRVAVPPPAFTSRTATAQQPRFFFTLIMKTICNRRSRQQRDQSSLPDCC